MRHSIILAFFVGALATLAGERNLFEGGQTFRPGNAAIEWKATTERKAVWVYKVMPQTAFTMAVISNAMVIGSLKSTDVVRDDKTVIRFQDRKRNESRYLEIKPAVGCIEYYDSQGKDIPSSVVGVPDSKGAERLGLDLLLRLGVDRDQIAPGVRLSTETKQSTFTNTGQETNIEVIARSFGFVRQIDGIPFRNELTGGFWIEFASNAKVAQFNLSWRHLVPHELYEVPRADEFVHSLQNGKAIYAVEMKPCAATKFTVTSLNYFYLGKLYNDPQDFVYPVARLGVVADLGGETNSFELLCPLAEINPRSAVQTNNEGMRRGTTNSEALLNVDRPVR